MNRSVQRFVWISILMCIAAAPTSAQVCAGAPSFRHVTWQTSAGLEFIGGGQRAGTSFVTGRDGLFGGALASTGHSDGRTSASWIVGGLVGSDRVIHRGRKVHLCPTFKLLYTIGPHQTGAFGPPIELNTLSMAAAATVGFVAHETVTRQIVPTFSLGFARDRTRANRDDQRLAETTDSFPTTAVGLGFVFDDQHAIAPQVTMAFKDPTRVTGFLVLVTLGFGIR
jgi:hypothetical protein